MTIAIHQIETAVCVSTKLLGFYNANTGGAQVKKFADRATAERRCIKLAQELDAEGVLSSELFIAISQGAAVEQHSEEAPLEFVPDTDICGPQDAAERDSMLAAMNSPTSQAQPVIGEFTHCPHCGIDLNNGVQDYDNLCADTSNHGVNVKSMQHHYLCLACNNTFGPKIHRTAKAPSVSTGLSRPAMAASLKLDRQIVSVASGIIYKNACQVWKAGLVSSSQCDRLSAVLYGAAKAGNRLMTVEINGHVFTLAVK